MDIFFQHVKRMAIIILNPSRYEAVLSAPILLHSLGTPLEQLLMLCVELICKLQSGLVCMWMGNTGFRHKVVHQTIAIQQSVINWSLSVVLCRFFLMDIVMVLPFPERCQIKMMQKKLCVAFLFCFKMCVLILIHHVNALVCKHRWSFLYQSDLRTGKINKTNHFTNRNSRGFLLNEEKRHLVFLSNSQCKH